MSKIKDIVERAGHFQVLPKSRLIMPLRKSSTFLFLNKSLLTVFMRKKEKMDVTEAGHLTYTTISLTRTDAQVINSTLTYLERALVQVKQFILAKFSKSDSDKLSLTNRLNHTAQ